MVQTAAPTSDVAVGLWTTQQGGTTNLFATINEAVADDTAYVQSPGGPGTADVYDATLGSLTSPGGTTGHVFRYRFQKSAAVDAQIDLTASLRQGASPQIAAWDHFDVANGYTTVAQTLTAAQAGAITDYTALRLRFATIAGSFLPSRLSGLALWLDANQLTGLNNNDPVATFTDFSGNGRNATQATGAAKPTYKTNQRNGLPGVSFSGTNGMQTAAVDLTATGALTIFAVFSAASTGDQVIVEMSADYNAQTDSFIVYRETGNKVQVGHKGNIGDNSDKSADTLTTTPKLVSVTLDKGAGLIATEEASVWLNAVAYRWNAYSVVNDTRFSTNDNTVLAFGNRVLNIGARNNAASLGLNGVLYDLLIYNRLLTGVEIGKVEAYLNDKWELC